MIFTLWVAFGLYHLAFTLIFALAFSKYRHAENERSPAISVVIAARNELKNLKQLIPALLQQDYMDFEVIVALDRCTDESKKYLKALAHPKVKSVEISEVPTGWNPKKYALTSAIDTASGEWLVLTDADCVPLSNQWLKNVTGNMKDGTEIILGVSPYRAHGTFLSHFIRFESFMTAFSYISKAHYGRPYMGVGRNMAIRKSFFHKVGGYLPFKSITGGDDDLFIQKNATTTNTRVVLGRESLMETEPEQTWKAYFHQKVRHLSVGHFYKKSDQLILGLNHGVHFLFVTGCLFNTTHSFFWPTLLFYLFIKFMSYRFAAGKIGTSINYLLLPLVDMLYALLTPVIALRSKLVKDIKWKN
ncbi:MAG: glycosyltransferase [Ekhidna sp.]|uniref:glycosyltransferase n=1 Tax=Ekhidna sp. TaxID=2608089 RepID=UPI0032EF108F